MITLVSNSDEKVSIDMKNFPDNFMTGYFTICSLQFNYKTEWSTNFLKQLKVFSKEGKWPYKFFELYSDIISPELNPRTKKGALTEFLGLPLNGGGVPLIKDDYDEYHRIEVVMNPQVVSDDVSGEFTFITDSNEKYVLSWKQLLKYPESYLTSIARIKSRIGNESSQTEIPDKIMKLLGGVYSDGVWQNFNPFMAENRDIQIGDIFGFDAICDYLGVPSEYDWGEGDEDYCSADEEYEEYTESLFDEYQEQFEEDYFDDYDDHYDDHYDDTTDYYDDIDIGYDYDPSNVW